MHLVFDSVQILKIISQVEVIEFKIVHQISIKQFVLINIGINSCENRSSAIVLDMMSQH